MLPNLFILSSSGEILIEKHWLSKVRRQVVDVYWELSSKVKIRAEVSPVLVTPRYYFISVVRYELTFLTIIIKETPPLLILEALNRVIDTFLEYFGKVGELVMRDNFSTVYQLLDEMIDGGFPSTTEMNQLKDMILPPSLARRVLNTVTGEFSVSQDLPLHVISKIPWRKADVKYVTNEIYFDIIEQIDGIINANQGSVVTNIYGDVRCACRLSGMPDLTLTFNKPSQLEDASLHRCVRINRFAREKVVSFIPPDGQFTLLTYKIPDAGNLPVYCKPVISYRQGSGRVYVQVGSKMATDKPITNLAVVIPLPPSLLSSSLTANVGDVKIDPSTQSVRWDIGRLPKETTPTLEGSLSFPPELTPEETAVVSLEFQAKMYACSGLKVDGLAIRGVPYKPFKGVRSITQAGKLQIRASEA